MDNVRIIRSHCRKTVAIKIEPDGTVSVLIPSMFSESRVQKLLRDQEEWIRSKQQIILSRNPHINKAGEKEYLYLGKSYPLKVRMGQKSLVEIEDKIYVGSASKTYAKTYLTSWYKQQARKIIVQRVYHYAKILGLSFKSISITSAETRWGSCSSEKSLNFNWKLIMAPLPVIDYVVAHELAHLIELNHSHSFWETVRKMFPLYRQYRLWLRRNGHALTV